MRQLRFAVLSLLLMSSASISNADHHTITKELDDALSKAVKVLNEHDASGVAMMYAEDADVMFSNGVPLKGRDEIRSANEDTFSANPKFKIEVSDVTRKVLTPEIVVESGISKVRQADETWVMNRYTAVLRKLNGKWLVVHERGWTKE